MKHCKWLMIRKISARIAAICTLITPEAVKFVLFLAVIVRNFSKYCHLKSFQAVLRLFFVVLDQGKGTLEMDEKTVILGEDTRDAFGLVAKGGDVKSFSAFVEKLAQDHEVYPTTLRFDNNQRPTSFTARKINKNTSVQDIKDGWTFNDWFSGWGPGEHWRIQLSRRLNDLESRRVSARLNSLDETPTVDEMIQIFTEVCESDLHVIRARVELIDATVVGKWGLIIPVPEDIKIVIREGN